MHLLVEVAPVDHAGELDGALQMELTPAPAYLRTAKRGRQRRRLAPKRLPADAQLLDLLAHRGLRGDPPRFHLTDPLTEPVETLLDRCHHVLGGAES